tara:strand:- start:255 stop:1319 length:1065 start_codon:yes stop_codon:yes gene_type:complete
MLSVLNQIKYSAKKNATPVSLEYLFKYGKDFRNKDNTENLFKHSQFLHKELPIRISKRILTLQELPYELNKYSGIQKIHDIYVKTFETLISHKIPSSSKDCNEYVNLLLDLKNKHKDTEFNIARCLSSFKRQYKDYNIYSDVINLKLNKFYESRIGLRLLIGHHIELNKNKNTDKNVGIIYKFKVEDILNNCIIELNNLFEQQYFKYPKINFKSINSREIIHIPNHIHYILFEVLKNSMEAVIQNNMIDNHEIEIKLIYNNEGITIHIFDQGGGFNYNNIEEVFSFLYTTYDLLENDYHDTPISGFGHGLGMSRLFVKYFGGDIKVIPLENYGTHTIINIKSLNVNERIADLKY